MTFEKWWQENRASLITSRCKEHFLSAWHDGYRAGWLANRPKIEQQEKDLDRLKAEAEGYRNGQLQAQALADGLHESCRKHGEWRKQAETRIERMEAENDRLRAALKAILDYGKEGPGTYGGYPAEVVYNDFSYKRMVDSYRDVADKALMPYTEETP